jgi:hypothetical protein
MSISETAKRTAVLEYIIRRHTESTVTSMMKIAYLADLLVLKNGLPRITDYTYIRYHYGPFDRKIYDDLDGLVRSGAVKSAPRYSGVGDGGEYWVFESLADGPQNSIDKYLQPDQVSLLDSLLNDIRGYGAKTLTEAAYQTRPMKKFEATLGGSEHLQEMLDLNA